MKHEVDAVIIGGGIVSAAPRPTTLRVGVFSLSYWDGLRWPGSSPGGIGDSSASRDGTR
jgi:hypothetical protein